MKKVILLIALSIVFIIASKLAAQHGVSYDVKYTPTDKHTYLDMKSIRLKWELIEIGFLGCAAASFGTGMFVYFNERKKIS